MKKLLLLSVIFAGALSAQVSPTNPIQFKPTPPSGACSSTYVPLNWLVGTGPFYYCDSTLHWHAFTGGGGGSFVLTTLGSSGAATFDGAVLNIPIYSGGGSTGTVTSVAWPTIPSWLTVTISNPTTAASISVVPTTAQTSHQVIGTCGSATTFAPCALVLADLPAALFSLTTTGSGASTYSAGTLNIPQYGMPWTLTTTGNSGAATYSSNVLNIPQYGTPWTLTTTGSGAATYSANVLNIPTPTLGTVTVVGAGNLTSTALVTGGGTQTLQTPSATSTLDSSGNMILAGKLTATSIASGSSPPTGITYGTAGAWVCGEGTAFTGLSTGQSGIYCDATTNLFLELLNGGSTAYALLGETATDTTTTHVLHASATGGVGTFSAIAAGDLPAALSGSTSVNGTTIPASATLITSTTTSLPSVTSVNGTTIPASGTLITSATTSLPSVTSVNGTTIPASSTLLTAIPSQYKIWTCETGVGDGLNAIPSATYLQTFCLNTTGVTVTITGLKCYSDGGTPTMNAAGATLGALLTTAVTCTTSFAAGTQSANVALTAGDWINFTFVAGGTAKQTTWVVTGTY